MACYNTVVFLVDITLTYFSKTLQEDSICKYVLKLDVWTQRVHILSREAY